MEAKKIAVIGGGRLGKSLAYQLKAKGHNLVGVACQSAASSQKTSELTGIICLPADELTIKAEIVFVTVPDDILESVCNDLANKGAIKPDTIVLHCSGSRPSSILGGAKKAGAHIGSLHPLQSFSGFDKNVNPFLNVNFTVEGENKATETACVLAKDLGAAHCYNIDTDGKILYHAAAVTASNYLVTLFNMTAGLLEKAGINKNDAFTLLAPLLNGTLKNLADNTPCYEMALTGPISRGDTQVVAGHLNAITAQTPEFLELYKILGQTTVDVAAKQGLLTKNTINELKSLLN